MDCARCGAALSPGVRECPDCGNRVYGNDFVYASITVSWEDARKGGLQTVEMRNLLNPLRVRLKPRTKNGDKIRVAGAMFRQEDESVLLAPVEVTVHVEPRPLWQRAVAAVLVLLLLGGAALGILTVADHWENQPEQQVSTTLPTQPTTRPTNPVTQTTAPSEPETTEAETTEPETTEAPTAESETTEPETTEPETTEPAESVPRSAVIMNYEYRPMLQQLSDDHLKIAEAIYQAYMNFEATVDIPCEIQPEDFNYLRRILHYECPELMQLDSISGGTYYTDNTTGNVVSFELTYILTEAEYDRIYSETKQVVDRLVSEMQGMTVWEVEWYIYDYITTNCIYDFDDEYAGMAYGTLVRETAKCDGFSFAIKWIMEEMGITCFVAGGSPLEGEIGHVWNYVLLDGSYYCLDVTPEVPKTGEERIRLFCAYNVSSGVVGRDFNLYPEFLEFVQLPAADSMEKSHHVLNGTYVYKGDDWQAIVKPAFLSAIDGGEDVFLQFEDQEEYKACLQVLNDRLREYCQDVPEPVNWMTWSHDGYNVIRVVLQ